MQGKTLQPNWHHLLGTARDYYCWVTISFSPDYSGNYKTLGYRDLGKDGGVGHKVIYPKYYKKYVYALGQKMSLKMG